MSHEFPGRRGAPKPPPHIWDELAEAGATNDQTRIDIAAAHYRQWLADEGYQPHQGRPPRADEAAR
jgi:hypothetical protein